MEGRRLLTDSRPREESHLVLLRRVVKSLCGLEAKGETIINNVFLWADMMNW